MSNKELPFKPIVEFFPLVDYDSTSYLFYPNEGKKLTPSQVRLRSDLAKVAGVYALYNSEAEIIYVGSTEKQDLLARIKQSLDTVRSRYKRFYVEHGEYKGRSKRIVRKSVKLWQVAEFFSAYEADPKLIKILEEFVIRMAPNDLINAKIEGNGKHSARPRVLAKGLVRHG